MVELKHIVIYEEDKIILDNIKKYKRQSYAEIINYLIKNIPMYGGDEDVK